MGGSKEKAVERVEVGDATRRNVLTKQFRCLRTSPADEKKEREEE